MKILRYEYRGETAYGILENGEIRRIKGNPMTGAGAPELSDERIPLIAVQCLRPVENPRQIIAIGLNYKAHIEEFKNIRDVVIPKFPVTFMAAQSALADPEEEIVIPFQEHQTDYEAELVIVIGKEAFQIGEAEASAYIFGYTCGNDLSDRDVQKQDQQWTRAKSYPGFKPTGPWIETHLDVTGLQLTTRVNGEIRQTGNTSSMIFPVARIVALLSSCMRLYPGDLIFTGTPNGVGPLRPGDVCEIEIQGIGILRNTIR